MRRILPFLIILSSLLAAGCWDASVRPIPLNPGTEERLFNSSIQSANNTGHGYFIISVPLYEPDEDNTAEISDDTDDGESSEAPVSAFAVLYIGRFASDETEEFLIESTSDSVTMMKSLEEDHIVLEGEIRNDERAYFRFDWDYSDSWWDLMYCDTLVIDKLRLEDGENISISVFEYIPDDSVPSEDGTIEPMPYPGQIQIEAKYNYFQN